MKQQFTEKKMKKPCKGCPFGRINDNEKPNPGGSHPSVYLGQARGPFWLPCHNDRNYDAKDSDPAVVKQCAGAAIFRANCNTESDNPSLLKLSEDRELVFSDEAEFFAYYSGMPENDVRRILSRDMLDVFKRIELSKAGVKRYDDA